MRFLPSLLHVLLLQLHEVTLLLEPTEKMALDNPYCLYNAPPAVCGSSVSICLCLLQTWSVHERMTNPHSEEHITSTHVHSSTCSPHMHNVYVLHVAYYMHHRIGVYEAELIRAVVHSLCRT